jgi:Asp-tRNA(Asn)/Glu-tRNA(Gln) amidotransferase A subunit family amidase
MTGLADLTLTGAAELLAERTISAVELLGAVLARLEETEPEVHAYASTDADASRQRARELDEAPVRGPLHGIPIGVKDVFCTTVLPTEAGSRVLAGYVAGFDAEAVAALHKAGAVLVGKHVTNEFALGQSPVPTRNPWRDGLYPGGSTVGGAVSVTVGSSFAALGTDAGGSIRKPAAINGVVGLKPTFGRINRAGVIPPSGSLDTIGPLTRTVADAAAMFGALAGVPPQIEAEGFMRRRKVRLGVPRCFLGPELDGEHRDAVERAMAHLKELGAELVPVDLPHIELASPAGQVILAVEAARSHRRWLRDRSDRYGTGTLRALLLGGVIPATHLQAALTARAGIAHGFKETFSGHALDALVGPTLPKSAPVLDTMEASTELPVLNRYTMPANLAGLPSLSLPCGATITGLPIGMMLTGRPDGEAALMSIGVEFQRSTTWHERRPRGALTSAFATTGREAAGAAGQGRLAP